LSHNPKETFDQLAKSYEESVDHESPYNTLYERPAMMELLPEELNGCRVLDAGCAAGWYVDMLTKRGAEVTGVDVSAKMISVARSRINGKAEVFQHDLEERLPFEDGTFDYIISSLTLP